MERNPILKWIEGVGLVFCVIFFTFFYILLTAFIVLVSLLAAFFLNAHRVVWFLFPFAVVILFILVVIRLWPV